MSDVTIMEFNQEAPSALTLRVSAATNHDFERQSNHDVDEMPFSYRLRAAALVTGCLFLPFATEARPSIYRMERATAPSQAWTFVCADRRIESWRVEPDDLSLDEDTVREFSSDSLLDQFARGNHFSIPADMAAEMDRVAVAIEATRRMPIDQWAHDLAATVRHLTD